MAWINYNVNICDKKISSIIIHLTKECPNSCSFCIDKLNKFKQNGKPNFDKIKETFLKYKDNIDVVLITGGEPLLYIEETLDLMKYIKANSDLPIVIDTSMPIQCYNNRETFYEIISLAESFLVSAHHYDPEKADIIRHSKTKYDREAFYKELPEKDKFLMSLNVFKPHLCDKQEVLDSIMYFNRLGFKNIKLAEMFDMDDIHVSISKLLGIKLKRPFAQGCTNSNVDISHLLPEFDGNLSIKTVCFYRCKHCYPNLLDLFKILTRNLFKIKKYFFGVIHPDGEIYPYWI